jgi:hypothetical protein
MHEMAAKACAGRPSGHLLRFSWTLTASYRGGRSARGIDTTTKPYFALSALTANRELAGGR